MAVIQFKDLRFDPEDGSLVGAGEDAVTLRPQVARLLETFLADPETVIDRERLCRAVWGDDRVVDFEAGLSALVKELRQALRAAGAPDDLLETVPRRGYRFHAAPSEVADGRVGPRRRVRPAAVVLATAVAAAVIVAVVVWIGAQPAPDAEPDPRPRMAVLPFEVLGTEDQRVGDLDLVLADTLLAAIWQQELDGLVLLGRTSIGSDLSGQARVEFVAHELGASLVLEGSLIPEAPDEAGTGWRIEARLLALPRGEVVWTRTVSAAPGGSIAVGDVAATLADDLAARWGAIRTPPGSSP